MGSSYLPGEILAAFLWAQMEEAETITRRRLDLWGTYHPWFVDLEAAGKIRRPIIPGHCGHNAHMYYLLLPGLEQRTTFIERLRQQHIQPVFHYVPLDRSPMGQRVARAHGDLRHTHDLADRLVRLPLWVGLEEHQAHVIQRVIGVVEAL